MRTVVRVALGIGALVVVLAALSHCRSSSSATLPASVASATPLDQIIRDRGLSPDEAAAALKVFVPPGKYDEFVMVTSGGHRGTVMLYGVPSMRLLKEIPVYASDAWQGWAQGETESQQVLREGSFGDKMPTLTWGDLHHPQISLTHG